MYIDPSFHTACRSAAEVDPVARHQLARCPGYDPVLQYPAVLLNDLGRGDIVGVAGNQHFLQSESSGFRQHQAQLQCAQTAPAVGRADVVADMAAFMVELLVQPVADAGGAEQELAF